MDIIEPERVEAKRIIEELKASGCKWVFINKETGKYKGERNIWDFRMQHRMGCYCLVAETDHHLKEDDLEFALYVCQILEVKLIDIKAT